MAAFTHLDTNTMPVSESPANPGAKDQTLWKDQTTGSTVQMSYGPAGFPPKVAEILAHGPHRHYHKTVNERHYILAGDYPIWHWQDASGDGKLTILRRHTFLENPPKALHGIRPETTPTIATQLLVWNNGPGTSIFDKEAEQETIEVPIDGSTHDVAWASSRILSTMDMAWRPHASVDGWKVKDLAPEVKDSPPVTLVNLPPDAEAGAQEIAGADRTWLFVLSGDLSPVVKTAEGPSQLSLQEGHFLAWSRGMSVTFPGAPVSISGCLALCVGHDLAS